MLFISMEFAPINSAGIYRQIRFINALAKNGINPIVITFSVDENLMKVQSNVDQNLINLVHPNAKIIRIPLQDISLLSSTSWGRFKYIMNNVSGDNFLKGWKKRIYAVIDQLVKEYSPAGIITSCPPFSSAILAGEISIKYNLPFILDMRDAWSEWGMAPSASYFHYLRKKKAERSVFRQATTIISVTPQLINKFKIAHPGIHPKKFELIYNSANFSIEKSFSVELKKIHDVSRIDIGYTGAFYYKKRSQRMKLHQFLQYYPHKEDWLYRTPYYFFKSIFLLFKMHPTWRTKIFFNYLGNSGEVLNQMIKEFGLEKNIIFHGYQSQENVKLLESKFDILLTTSEKVIDNEHYCLPSKLFTYLVAQKPIFAFVTAGIQNEFMNGIGIGQVFNPDEIEQNAKLMEGIFTNGWVGTFNSSYFKKYEEESTSAKFVKLIKEHTARE